MHSPDPRSAPPYPLLSMISLLKKDWDNAILYGEKGRPIKPQRGQGAIFHWAWP